MACQQCGRPAIVEVGPEGQRLRLCLSCYSVFSQINAEQMRILQERIDRTEREMYLITGLPMPEHLRTRRPIVMGDIRTNNIHVSGGTVGIINTGKIEQANVAVRSVPDDTIKGMLEAVVQAIRTAEDAAADQQSDALDLVSTVADEASKPAAERRVGTVKRALEGLATAATTIKSLADVWAIAEPVVRRYFGV